MSNVNTEKLLATLSAILSERSGKQIKVKEVSQQQTMSTNAEQIHLFSFIEDGEKYLPKKSTDWKWTFADYPKETYRTLEIATHKDLRIADVFQRLGEKERCFGAKIAWEENVLQTITGKYECFRGVEKTRISVDDIIHAQTFPEDYIFNPKTFYQVAYICGMSVPPVMIKRIVLKLIEQNIFAAKGEK